MPKLKCACYYSLSRNAVNVHMVTFFLDKFDDIEKQ